MVTVIKREKAKFRVYIHDLETKEARCISLMNDKNKSVDDIKKGIINCLRNLEKQKSKKRKVFKERRRRKDEQGGR